MKAFIHVHAFDSLSLPSVPLSATIEHCILLVSMKWEKNSNLSSYRKSKQFTFITC